MADNNQRLHKARGSYNKMQTNLKSLQDKIKDLQTKLQGADLPVQEESHIESKNSSYMVRSEKSSRMNDKLRPHSTKGEKKSRNDTKDKLNS